MCTYERYIQYIIRTHIRTAFAARIFSLASKSHKNTTHIRVIPHTYIALYNLASVRMHIKYYIFLADSFQRVQPISSPFLPLTSYERLERFVRIMRRMRGDIYAPCVSIARCIYQGLWPGALYARHSLWRRADNEHLEKFMPRTPRIKSDLGYKGREGI